MSMLFSINNSPFFGKEGKFVTSRHLRDRLLKETEKNLALRVMDTHSADSFLVFGRGILHLSVLIETMRREGYELTVGQPQVLTQEGPEGKEEPWEVLVVDIPEEYAGKVIDYVTMRKGEMTIMETKGSMQHLEFMVPSRGLIGLRSQLLTATAGEVVMAHRFDSYRPWKGSIPGRIAGVLVSIDTGSVTAYSLEKLQDRGRFFVEPGELVYAGQILGENARPDDLGVNLVKAKQLTNMRAAGKDDNARLAPKINFSLEEAMEYIQEDECLEVTPQSIRLRKVILDENERKRREKSMASA